MPETKVGPKELADMVFLAATGHSASEIAEELGVSARTVQRHLSELKEETKEVGPQRVVARVMIEAGPEYILRFTPFKFTLDEFINELKGGEE